MVLPEAHELENIGVDELVQAVFMKAKDKAEGAALMGTVMHVVNRLPEQRDVALQQCAALHVEMERANLAASLSSNLNGAADSKVGALAATKVKSTPPGDSTSLEKYSKPAVEKGEGGESTRVAMAA